MARKFVAVWHERRWTASGDDMGRPLLDEDEREEQAHDVRFWSESELLRARGIDYHERRTYLV